MKWVLVVCFLAALSRCKGSAIRCTLENQDGSCPDENIENGPLPPLEVLQETTTEATPEAECLAGTEWDSNCHLCRCSDSGVAECLKQDTCGEGIFTEPLRCKPNTTFVRDCNTCVCLENGLALCTIEYCRRSGIPKKSELKAGKHCAPGSAWRSRCSDCKCSETGYSVCNATTCRDSSNEPEMRCAPDTMWKNDCNTCWCTTQGRAVCTKIGCVGLNLNFEKDADINADDKDFTGPNSSLLRKVRATPQEAPKACQPGQEFRLDCNKCLCDNEGQDFSCTRIDCIALNNNNNNNGGGRSKREASDVEEIESECTPGSVFEKDCNACRCTTDGHHAMCSIKRCQEESKKKSTESENRDPESDPGFRCNPGEQFKRKCNDCTCSADGKSYFCTLRLCDQSQFLSSVV